MKYIRIQIIKMSENIKLERESCIKKYTYCENK